MFRAYGNVPDRSLDGTSGGPMPHTHGGFGERHANKSTKAIIGIAILIVLSIVLYALRSSRHAQVSLASHAIHHRFMH